METRDESIFQPNPLRGMLSGGDCGVGHLLDHEGAENLHTFSASSIEDHLGKDRKVIGSGEKPCMTGYTTHAVSRWVMNFSPEHLPFGARAGTGWVRCEAGEQGKA